MIFFSKSAKRPQKIGGGGNVATIGNLDISAILTYDAPDMLEELLTARSDHHRIKRKLYTSIANTGELYDITEEDKKLDKTGGTLELKNIYIQTLGLMIH